MSGTLGLVGRASNPPKRRTPPEMNPAARWNGNWRRSAFYRVIALAVLALSGCHGKAHLLADRPRQEPAYGMRLPACCFHQFLGRGPAGPLQQFQDFGGLAAIPCGSALLLALGCFGRFLGGGGLLPRLALLGRNVGATFGSTGRFGSFRLRSYAGGRRFGLFCIRDHVFSFVGDYRGHDMNHSGQLETQGNSDNRNRGQWDGDDPPRSAQMIADERPRFEIRAKKRG